MTFRHYHHVHPRGAAGESYTPNQLAALYSWPTPSNPGQGQTAGIIELGGAYSTSDMATFLRTIGVTPSASVTIVSVDGATQVPDPGGADVEVMLDAEVIAALCPYGSLRVYFAPNTAQGFVDAILQAVKDGVDVISISWGQAENEWAASDLESMASAIAEAFASGIPVCVASGDNGSADAQNNVVAITDFPASSLSVSCGATSLPGSNLANETIWNNAEGASGGGVSHVTAEQSYEVGYVPMSVDSPSYTGHGVPLVAMNGDPSTGYVVVADGETIVVGGTSCVAPMMAALIMLIQQTMGSIANNLLEVLWSFRGTPAFRQITNGNNGSYSTTVGTGTGEAPTSLYNCCSGLGVPVGNELLSALNGGNPTPTPAPTPTPPTPEPPAPPPSVGFELGFADYVAAFEPGATAVDNEGPISDVIPSLPASELPFNDTQEGLDADGVPFALLYLERGGGWILEFKNGQAVRAIRQDQIPSAQVVEELRRIFTQRG